MSRDLRIEYEGAFHHVMSRGYHKMDIFHDNQDFNRFLGDIKHVFLSHTLVIHAYCLMNNHFHLFTETPYGNLQKAMQRLLTRYACYYKNKYDHSGKVFERRYKAILIDSDSYALDLTKYIHRNPVDVIVSNPLDWTYSSYRQYLEYDSKQCFLDRQLILNRFDSDKNTAIAKFKEHMELDEGSVWSPDDLIIGGSILGSKDFIDRIKDKLPDEINTEISGLIKLRGDEKISAIKKHISCLSFDLRSQINLLLYALRERTSLNTQEINQLIGTKFKKSTISSRIDYLKETALKDKKMAKALIGIKSL